MLILPRTVVPIFDMGNVLVNVNMDKFHEGLVKLGLFRTVDEASRFTKHIEQMQNLGITNFYNAIAYHDTFDIHGNRAQKESLYAAARDYWATSREVWQPNVEILDWVLARLEDHTYEAVALASNMGIDHYTELMKCHELFQHPFVLRCFSYQMGAVKPHYLFWKTFFNRFRKNNRSLKLDDCRFLYMDDRQDYLDGAIEYTQENEIELNWLKFDSSLQDQEVLIQWLESYRERR